MSFRVYINVIKNGKEVFSDQLFGNHEFPDPLGTWFEKNNIATDKSFHGIRIPIMDLITIMRECEIKRRPPISELLKKKKHTHEIINTMSYDFSKDYSNNSNFVEFCEIIDSHHLLRFPILINKLRRLGYLENDWEFIVDENGNEELVSWVKERQGVEITIDGF